MYTGIYTFNTTNNKTKKERGKRKKKVIVIKVSVKQKKEREREKLTKIRLQTFIQEYRCIPSVLYYEIYKNKNWSHFKKRKGEQKTYSKGVLNIFRSSNEVGAL